MENLELVHFQANAILFNEGEETFFFYMIKEGQVEIYRTTDEGKKIILAEVQEGQSLGEFAMIDRQPRSASARALTDVVAVKVSEQAYAALLAELPTWVQAMLEGLVTRLRKANEIIERHESIDEQTKTDFHATEFDQENTKTIDVELDFSDLAKITLPKDPKRTG